MRDDALIAALASDLAPVRPLWRPAARAAAWLGVVLVVAAGLVVLADMGAVRSRMAEAVDLRFVLLGSVLTTVLAVLAAFELSVPGRPGWWLAVPLPAVALWVGASGWGCLRAWVWPGLVPATLGDTFECVRFITLVSVPLSALLLWMVSRGCPLCPGRAAAMAGLAGAAASASLLTLFHPFDASAVDLLMHGLAVAVVVGVCRAVAGVLG